MDKCTLYVDLGRETGSKNTGPGVLRNMALGSVSSPLSPNLFEPPSEEQFAIADERVFGTIPLR